MVWRKRLFVRVALATPAALLLTGFSALSFSNALSIACGYPQGSLTSTVSRAPVMSGDRNYDSNQLKGRRVS
jgi:hypothetical protein